MALLFFAHMGVLYLIDSFDVRTSLGTPVCHLDFLQSGWTMHMLCLFFFSE